MATPTDINDAFIADVLQSYSPPGKNKNNNTLNSPTGSKTLEPKQVEWVRNVDGTVLMDHRGRPVTVDRILATKPLRSELSSRPGPGNKKLTYLSGEGVTRTLNDVFGFDGWSLEIKHTNREQCVKDDKDRYHVAYTATVRLIHRKSGAFKEDCGAGDSIDRAMGTAIAHALKASITDAMKRAARHFGDKLGNSLYQGTFTISKAPTTLKAALDQYDIERANSKFGFPPKESTLVTKNDSPAQNDGPVVKTESQATSTLAVIPASTSTSSSSTTSNSSVLTEITNRAPSLDPTIMPTKHALKPSVNVYQKKTMPPPQSAPPTQHHQHEQHHQQPHHRHNHSTQQQKPQHHNHAAQQLPHHHDHVAQQQHHHHSAQQQQHHPHSAQPEHAQHQQQGHLTQPRQPQHQYHSLPQETPDNPLQTPKAGSNSMPLVTPSSTALPPPTPGQRLQSSQLFALDMFAATSKPNPMTTRDSLSSVDHHHHHHQNIMENEPQNRPTTATGIRLTGPFTRRLPEKRGPTDSMMTCGPPMKKFNPYA